MSPIDPRFANFLNALAERRQRVYDYLFNHEYGKRIAPTHLNDAAYSYLRLGGKSLRPAVMLLCCAAVGGQEDWALPAAAGIEVYHTWTLVHDDVIDRDDVRRGKPTVHVEFATRGANDLGYQGEQAVHYGRTIAILAGDVQQSWAYLLFHDLHTRCGVDAALVLRIVGELMTTVQLTLVEGETLDVQFTHKAALELTEPQVIEMLRKKTGMLYEFAGWTGAMIGLNDLSGQHPEIGAIARFCSACGTAFQLQDDILGVVGDQAQTGKPVGHDIREGKKTLMVFHALRNATKAQQKTLMTALGNPDATPEQIAAATDALREAGSLDYTRQTMHRMIEDALRDLDTVRPSPYRDLLREWATFMIERSQ